ncbi:MAG: Rieske 2Fe-2S domain-containing protein [Deltaproteobacteria bacterium]|nr:Rieske 2Fe-2S domain-containing protein [Deltaproteobacteria bacterium]
MSVETPQQDPNPARQGSPRRSWLWKVGVYGLGAAFVQAVWSTFRFARATVSYGPPKKFNLGPLERFAPGLTTFVEGAGVFVKRDEQGVRAMSAVCTHLGCTVRSEGSGFVCPCHGSRYDEEGHVVSGPAPDPLAFYELKQDGKRHLVVDLARPVDPKTRLRGT